jgi:hypothetical protein
MEPLQNPVVGREMWATKPEDVTPALEMKFNVGRQFDDVRTQLYVKAKDIAKTATEVKEKMESWHWQTACMNSMGELQSSGVYLDILCGQFAELQKVMRHIETMEQSRKGVVTL